MTDTRKRYAHMDGALRMIKQRMDQGDTLAKAVAWTAACYRIPIKDLETAWYAATSN